MEKDAKKKTGWQTFRNGAIVLWQLIEDYRDEYLKLALWLIGFELVNFIPPIFLKIIFDEIYQAQKDSSIIYILMLVSLGLGLQIAALYYGVFNRKIKFIRKTSSVEKKLPDFAYEKLLGLTLGYHEDENTGEKISKIYRGCGNVASSLYAVYDQVLPQLLYILINIPIVVYLDYRLGLVFFVPFVPLMIINSKMVNKFNPIWYQVEKEDRKAFGKASDGIYNIFTVQSYHQEETELATFSSLQSKVRDVESDAVCQMQKYYFATDVLIKTFIGLTLALGLVLVIRGKAQAGTVVYILNTGGATLYYVSNLFRQYARLNRQFIPIAQLKEVLDEKPEIQNDPHGDWPEKIKDSLTFGNVSYSYKKNGCAVENLNFHFEFGKTYALVAKTGGGKTTVFKLLTRMIDPDQGSIRLGDKDIRTLRLFDFRRLFAVVQQDSPIFNDTIAANVRYYDQQAPEELVEESLRLAQAEFALKDSEKYPKGIHEKISEKGGNLSAGEKQRIVIARAILALKRGAIFLIMDEGTANLDTITELKVLQSFEKMRRRSPFTSIIVSHRIAVVQRSDRIYVMEDGRVIEQGNDEELMAQKGTYHDLKASQSFDDLFL